MYIPTFILFFSAILFTGLSSYFKMVLRDARTRHNREVLGRRNPSRRHRLRIVFYLINSDAPTSGQNSVTFCVPPACYNLAHWESGRLYVFAIDNHSPNPQITQFPFRSLCYDHPFL